MLAIKNGKIITPDGIIENKSVLIDEGRIIDFSKSEKKDRQGHQRSQALYNAGLYRHSLRQVRAVYPAAAYLSNGF